MTLSNFIPLSINTNYLIIYNLNLLIIPVINTHPSGYEPHAASSVFNWLEGEIASI